MSTTLLRPQLRRPILLAITGVALAAISAGAAFIVLRESGPSAHFIEYPMREGS